MEAVLDRIRQQDTAKLAHIKSPAVLLKSVDTTLLETQTDPKPTAYFAALSATLESILSSKNTSEELLAAVLYLEAAIAPYVPKAVYVARSQMLATSLAKALVALSTVAESAPALKSLLTIVESFYEALSPNDLAEPGVSQLFNTILLLLGDARPKLRRKAHDVVRAVVFETPAHPYTERVSKFLIERLIESAKDARQPKRRSTEAAIAELLALCAFVNLVVKEWPEKHLSPLLETLLALPRLNNEYLTQSAFETLDPILSRSSNASPEALFEHFQETLMLCGSETSSSVLRKRAEQTACSLIRWCLPVSLQDINVACSLLSAGATPESAAHSPLYCVTRLLFEALSSLHFRGSGISHVLKITSQLFEALKVRVPVAGSSQRGPSGAALLLTEHLRTIEKLRTGEHFEYRNAADGAIGAAVTVCGPEWVLSILPLNLFDADRPESLGNGRAWLLTVLRGRIFNASLDHFVQYFVPLSEKIFTAKMAIQDKGETGQLQSKIYDTLVEQIWALFPGYCDLPYDLPTAFTKTFAELLSQVLYSQPNLRSCIFRGVTTLVTKNQQLASTTATPAEPQERAFGLTAAGAQANLQHLSSLAPNLLAVMFNVTSKERLDIGGSEYQCISALLSIAKPQALASIFNKVNTMLTASLKEKQGIKKDKSFDKTHALMELCVAFASNANADIANKLFQLGTSEALLAGKDSTLQKKTYKMLNQLFDSPQGKKLAAAKLVDIIQLLSQQSAEVSSAAKRERIELLNKLVAFIPSTQLHLLPPMLSEVILSTKEANEKTREAAFDLLLSMAEKMKRGGTLDRAQIPGMEQSMEHDTPASITEFFTMVSAGLTSDPHMISASIVALSRLFFDYYADLDATMVKDLLDTLVVFLRSPTREVTKSTFGFVKVALVALPQDAFSPYLPEVVPSLLEWCTDHKNHFNLKARHILERLIRKFGYDQVASFAEEDGLKVLSNIKKRQQRAKKQTAAVRAAAADKVIDSDNEADEPKQTFKSAFDEVLYGDEVSQDEESEDENQPSGKGARGKRGKKQQQHLRLEDDGTGDLLEGGSVSVKDPRARSRKMHHAIKTDARGRMVIEDDSLQADSHGADAYLEAISGQGNGGTGKRRRNADDDDDWVDQVDDKLTIQNAQERSSGSKKRKKAEPETVGKEFKAKKAGGDVKRNGVQPYAYVSLDAVAGKGKGRKGVHVVDKGRGRR